MNPPPEEHRAIVPDAETRQITLRYSEPLVREAVRAFVTRSIIRGFGLRSLIAFALVVFCLVTLIFQGDRSWVVGAMAATLLFIGVFLLILYLSHYRHTVGRFRKMRVPEAAFSYTEEHFTLASENASTTLPWSMITEVWRFPRFWLILYSRSQFSTLPLDCLDAETQAFITRKTERHGPSAAS